MSGVFPQRVAVYVGRNYLGDVITIGAQYEAVMAHGESLGLFTKPSAAASAIHAEVARRGDA